MSARQAATLAAAGACGSDAIACKVRIGSNSPVASPPISGLSRCGVASSFAAFATLWRSRQRLAAFGAGHSHLGFFSVTLRYAKTGTKNLRVPAGAVAAPYLRRKAVPPLFLGMRIDFAFRTLHYYQFNERVGACPASNPVMRTANAVGEVAERVFQKPRREHRRLRRSTNCIKPIVERAAATS
jgi:hypothetical protein